MISYITNYILMLQAYLLGVWYDGPWCVIFSLKYHNCELFDHVTALGNSVVILC